MEVVVLAEGTNRSTIVEALLRFGHSPVSAERASAGFGDTLIVDLREAAPRPTVVDGLCDDPRPVLVIAERPDEVVGRLCRRDGRTLLLTAGENEAGLRVALTTLSGLSRRPVLPGRAAAWTAAV